MRKVKRKGRDVNSRGWRRYFYRGIRNHAKTRLILVGAPTQREAHARAKHHGRVTPQRVVGLLHAQVVLHFALLLDAPHCLHYRASGRNLAGLVPSGTRWRSWHKLSCHGLARLSSHSVQLQRLAQEPRGFVGFSKLTPLTRNHLEQAHKWSNKPKHFAICTYANYRVILLSIWVYEHLEMFITCVGMLIGLPHLQIIGWRGINSLPLNYSRWTESFCFCCRAYRTVRCTPDMSWRQ
jgi:hypothetical protein